MVCLCPFILFYLTESAVSITAFVEHVGQRLMTIFSKYFWPLSQIIPFHNIFDHQEAILFLF